MSFPEFIAKELSGQTIDYWITLKDNEGNSIQSLVATEEKKARKVLQNGRIVIQQGDKVYNLNGTLAE